MIYELLLILYFVGCIAGLWFVFKKAGEKPWKALIPIYNIVVWIKICGKDWKWYIYFLIPAINVFVFLLPQPAAPIIIAAAKAAVRIFTIVLFIFVILLFSSLLYLVFCLRY